MPLIDSVDGAFKLLSWSGLKATLKGYFDNVYAAAASLATVATSGSYNDLGDKPTIPAETPDATTGAKGKVQLATAAEVRSAAPGDKAFVASLIKDASALVALTDAATVAIDWSAFVVGDLVVTANRTIGNPTNVQPGVSRSFFVFGSDATERSIIWGSAYKGNMPTETVTSTRGLLVTLTPKAAGTIAVTYVVLE